MDLTEFIGSDETEQDDVLAATQAAIDEALAQPEDGEGVEAEAAPQS